MTPEKPNPSNGPEQRVPTDEEVLRKMQEVEARAKTRVTDPTLERGLDEAMKRREEKRNLVRQGQAVFEQSVDIHKDITKIQIKIFAQDPKQWESFQDFAKTQRLRMNAFLKDFAEHPRDDGLQRINTTAQRAIRYYLEHDNLAQMPEKPTDAQAEDAAYMLAYANILQQQMDTYDKYRGNFASYGEMFMDKAKIYTGEKKDPNVNRDAEINKIHTEMTDTMARFNEFLAKNPNKEQDNAFVKDIREKIYAANKIYDQHNDTMTTSAKDMSQCLYAFKMMGEALDRYAFYEAVIKESPDMKEQIVKMAEAMNKPGMTAEAIAALQNEPLEPATTPSATKPEAVAATPRETPAQTPPVTVAPAAPSVPAKPVEVAAAPQKPAIETKPTPVAAAPVRPAQTAAIPPKETVPVAAAPAVETKPEAVVIPPAAPTKPEASVAATPTETTPNPAVPEVPTEPKTVTERVRAKLAALRKQAEGRKIATIVGSKSPVSVDIDAFNARPSVQPKPKAETAPSVPAEKIAGTPQITQPAENAPAKGTEVAMQPDVSIDVSTQNDIYVAYYLPNGQRARNYVRLPATDVTRWVIKGVCTAERGANGWKIRPEANLRGQLLINADGKEFWTPLPEGPFTPGTQEISIAGRAPETVQNAVQGSTYGRPARFPILRRIMGRIRNR